MPLITNRKIPGARVIGKGQRFKAAGMVRLFQRQAELLPARWVYLYLDTSDKGGKGRIARHSWLYYAKPKSILSCKRSTDLMVETASKKLEKQLFDSLPCC